MFTRFELSRRHLAIALLVISVGIVGFLLFDYLNPVSASYSEFKRWVRQDRVLTLTITENTITGTLKAEADGLPARRFKTGRVFDPELVPLLEQHRIEFKGASDYAVSQTITTLLNLFIFGLLAWFGWRFMKNPNGLMRFGQSRAKMYMEQDILVRFQDVAGIDEAREELQEVVAFLRTPQKFTKIGGRIPKGVLLVGPPGTGKTLLARAVAGEAGVPFFSISGSAFVELFVGTGAARVRDLFDRAQKQAPCIVFIDELDALGKVRETGAVSHEEREHTLNQLLVEMDGFDVRTGVVVLAATNRGEILDPALLRPGRFDRQVVVSPPDRKGRLAILELHARQITLGREIKFEAIAAMTPGMSGADLANVVNEAALLAARRDNASVSQRDFEDAVERVVAGLERKHQVLSEPERTRVAHHEVGHALMALLLPGADPVHKISIVARGQAALGFTMQVPTEDRFLMTRSQLENKIGILLSGLIAEELVYEEISTGAYDDLRKATDIARRMVTEFGMSETLGIAAFDSTAPAPGGYKDRPARTAVYSERTAADIDSEVVRLLEKQKLRAGALLRGLKPALLAGAALLLEQEVMTGEELQAVLEEHRPR
jgi:cell division protease FtsH